MKRQSVIDMLDSCGWGATNGIGFLEDKCLIEDDDGYLRMHNLLREMGKQIVKEESKDPGKRRILWESSDVHRVFSRTSESKAVEAIRLAFSDDAEPQLILHPNDFAKLPYLKFLALNNADIELNVQLQAQCPRGLDYLPNELRLLHWNYCALKCLPAQFQPTNLIELDLSDSQLEELWEGSKDLRSLQSIVRSNSRYLTKLPDLSFATNLMKMDLSGCYSLVEISSSIKNFHKLQSLNLAYCRNIRSLPCCIWKLKSLQELLLRDCSELENLSESMEFPEPSTSQLSPLKRLVVKHCTKIRFLPELSGELLQEICASGCESLETSLFDLKQLFISQSNFQHLDDNHRDNIRDIFDFTNCWKLDVRWAEIAALAKKRIQVGTALSYFKTDFNRFGFMDDFYMGYPGCKIPKWITHQNMGNSITLQIPVNERLLGFAISAILPICDCTFSAAFSVNFSFKNSSGGSFFWCPAVVTIRRCSGDSLTEMTNTIIYSCPLSADDHSNMIDELGSDGDYYEVNLKINYCMCGIKRPENIKCGMIPLFFQNANGQKLETSLHEKIEAIIKDNNGNLEVFIDEYRVKKPNRKILSEMYKEVMIDNPEVNHQGILCCIWGNENCKRSNEVQTFSWLNEGYNMGPTVTWLNEVYSNEDEDAQNLGDMKPTITEESKTWKLTEINEPSQCWSLRLPDGLKVPKVSRLVYTNWGNSILALASNTIHLVWRLLPNYAHLSRKDDIIPHLEGKPLKGRWMINEIADTNPEEAIPCFALSKGDFQLVSASGGKISIFNIETFEKMETLMSPASAATYLAFHPQDSNVIAIGTDDDSTILICNTLLDEVIKKLNGHLNKVTGLAFSQKLNVLVSSGANAQLCVWSCDRWKKQKDCFLEVPRTAVQSSTHVQFHNDQKHFLVVHETQLAIYETTTLECVKHWVTCESPISHATFSCDSQLVYACFFDATICVFRTANLSICSRINHSSYLPANVRDVHPLVVAAHPRKRNQFALGVSDGEVYILQPLESIGVWDVPAHSKNESANCEISTPPIGHSDLDEAQTYYKIIDFMQVQAAATAYDTETVTLRKDCKLLNFI